MSMLPERSLNEAIPVEAGGSFWASPETADKDVLAPQPMLRNGLFQRKTARKTEQRDRPNTTRSGKYPFKWTVLGLVLFCSAFWAALFWLFFR